MKPHILKMKAFGPFVDETVVDFDKMGDSVFLITGDTGSGKTTIFDAMVYALYGEASGAGRTGLKGDGLYSDFAISGNKKGEMSVEFSFSNGEDEYNIVRTLNWGKTGTAQKSIKNSSLYKNGNQIASAENKAETTDSTTTKIKEILNLDAEQFKRIIMLAQGEFKAFLTGNSNEKEAILKKLYPCQAQEDVQARLKAAELKIKNIKDDLTKEGNISINNFRYPEDVEDSKKESLNILTPDIICIFTAYLDNLIEESEETEAKHGIIQDKINTLNTEITTAEENNKRLDDLDKAKADKERLESNNTENDDNKKKSLRAKKAKDVLVFENDYLKLQRDKQKIEFEVKSYEAKEITLTQDKENCETTAKRIEAENKPVIDDYKAEITRIESEFNVYDEYENALKELKTADRVYAVAKKKREEFEVKLKATNDRLDENRSSIEKLGDVSDSAILMAEKKLSELNERDKELNNLQKKLVKLISDGKSVAKAKSIYEVKSNEYVILRDEYTLLSKKYMSSSASFLASDLIKDINTNGEAFCPVCGVKHTKDDIHLFAKTDNGEDVTSEAVKTANEKQNDAFSVMNDAHSDYITKNTAYESDEKSIREECLKLINTDNLDTIIGGNILSDAIVENSECISVAEDEKKKAENDKSEKERLEGEKKKLENTKAEIENKLPDIRAKEFNAGNIKSTWEANVENYRKQLSDLPESKVLAESKISSLNNKISALENAIAKAKTNADKAAQDLKTLEGKLEAERKHLCDTKEKLISSESSYHSEIITKGFTDESDYKNAMSSGGRLFNDSELEAYIIKLDKGIEAFEKMLTSAVTKYDTQKALCENIVRTDVNEKRSELIKIEAERDSLDKISKNLYSMIDTDKKTIAQVTKISSELDMTGRMYDFIVNMSNIANKEKDKPNFSKYILSDFFDRILSYANDNLYELSDGELELRRKDKDGINSALELVICDNKTGYTRDTATLSGGQMFEAALSLALGLSESVKAQSTSGIRIDSMFIDEGFGSLDESSLDRIIKILEGLSQNNRQIGIISHVQKLEENIGHQIKVTKSKSGSSISTVIKV